MAAEEEVVVIARLAGETAYIRNADMLIEANLGIGTSADRAGLAMGRATRHSWAMNQALFTLRRLAYGATLAFVAMGVEAVRLGFSFNSSMQQARVALQPVSKDIGGVQNRLTSLFNFTKYTPFQFKDVTIAFRQMYLGMRTVGVTADDVQNTLHSVVDALSATGRTTPGALNRVAVALQHMAYQGHLTGYTVNQLARDGLPIFAALRHELGLTGDQLHQVGSLGIPTKVVLKALNDYIEKTPGLANAAYRQATGSLSGLFTTFKDNVSQLMGNMEMGVFKKFQSRLISFNAFFDRIGKSMQQHASFATIIGDAFGGKAEFIWKQFATDIELVWRAFVGLVRAIVSSKVVWGTLIAVLVILHGLLIPIVWAIEHMGWLISYGLVPAFIAYWTILKVVTIWQAFYDALMAASGDKVLKMTFFQILLNGAMRAYFLTLRMLIFAQVAWSILTKGYIKDANGLFRAMGPLEKMILKVRFAILWLRGAVLRLIPALVSLDFAALANPYVLLAVAIVALITGLIILYFKWKWFHDLVNRTVRFLYNNPLVAIFVPVIGVLFVWARLLKIIYDHMKDIYNLAKKPLGWIHDIGGMFGGWLGKAGGFVLHNVVGVPSIPGMGGAQHSQRAVGGPQAHTKIIGAPSMKQLQGQYGQLGNLGMGAMGQMTKPVTIQFVVGQRVLESAVVDVMNDRIAHQ